MSTALRIGFVGAGVVGSALGKAFAGAGYAVVAVASRSRASAEQLAGAIPGCRALDPQGVADAADLVFITTPDDAIGSVVASLRWRPGQRVVHCSGADSLEPLAPAEAAGALVGGLHPLQTFASVEAALAALPGTTFAVEAAPPLREELGDLARALGGAVVYLGPGDKVLYHAAAVLASNYVVTLASLATDLWTEFGAPRDEALAALRPLLQGAVANLGRVGLPSALTGPIARGDLGTVERHLAVLGVRAPDVLPVYRALGLAAIPVALAKGRLDPAAARRIAAALGADEANQTRLASNSCSER